MQRIFCGVRSGRDVDKFRKLNLTKEKAQFVSAPMIGEAPVSIECRVIPREDLIEQRHFTVRLGHGTYKIDSAAHWKKYGRADVLNLSSGETTCGY